MKKVVIGIFILVFVISSASFAAADFWQDFKCMTGFQDCDDVSLSPGEPEEYNYICVRGPNAAGWESSNNGLVRIGCDQNDWAGQSFAGYNVRCIGGEEFYNAFRSVPVGKSGDQVCNELINLYGFQNQGVCSEVMDQNPISEWSQKYCSDLVEREGFDVNCIIGSSLEAIQTNNNEGQSGDERCAQLDALCIEVHDSNWYHRYCDDKNIGAGWAVRCLKQNDYLEYPMHAIDEVTRQGASGFRVCAENSYRTTTQAGELVAYYKLDGNANDALGNNNGENIGASFVDEGRINGAASFEQGDYIKVTNNPSIRLDRGVTISGWIKDTGDNTDGGYATIAGKWNLPYEYFFGIQESEGKLALGIQDGNSFPLSTKRIENGIWTFVAVTFREDDRRYYFYVNDELSGWGSLNKQLIRSNSDFYLGRAAGGNSWIGQLDEVKVWNKALNHLEILEVYNSYNPEEEKTCTDNDGGINYETYGEVKACYGDDNCEISEDECQGEYLTENFCNGGDAESETYSCPYGCSEGACLPEPSGQTCTDSDGGIDFYEQGTLSYCNDGNCINETDSCIDQGGYGELTEFSCVGNGYWVSRYGCAFGCTNGACTQPNQSASVCRDLIDKVVYPENFEINGVQFQYGNGNSWRGRFYINGQEEEATSYYSSWHAYNNNEWSYIGYEIALFDNTDIDLREWLNGELAWRVCKTDYYQDNHPIYICNWDILYGRQNTEYEDKSRELIWFNDNVLVRINTYQGRQLSEEEMNSLANEIMIDFLEKLKNNEREYVDWENFQIEYPLNIRVSNALYDCPSDVELPTNEEGEECYPEWSCVTEPVICPPHGYQTKRCVDYSCGKTLENQIQCTPGLCSGCYVPRWVGYSNGDNICVPYGIRLTNENIDDNERLNEGTTSEDTVTFTLDVLSKYEATLSIADTSGFSRFYNLYDGQTVTIEFPESIGAGSVTIRIDKIFVGDEGQDNGYIEFSTINLENAYCDIDGNIKTQKEKRGDGSWASCQNNYECASNFCSAGECVEINDGIKQIGLFKSIFVRALCKITNPINDDDFNACIIEYLGELPEGTLQSPA